MIFFVRSDNSILICFMRFFLFFFGHRWIVDCSKALYMSHHEQFSCPKRRLFNTYETVAVHSMLLFTLWCPLHFFLLRSLWLSCWTFFTKTVWPKQFSLSWPLSFSLPLSAWYVGLCDSQQDIGWKWWKLWLYPLYFSIWLPYLRKL